MTIADILVQRIGLIPDFYRSDEEFKKSVESIKVDDLGLAIQALIKLADNSGHYFSEQFWIDLATCAEKMEMTSEVEYCRQQVRRNEIEIGSKTPNGWTTIKIDDSHFQHHIAETIKDEWKNQRRQKDKLDKLLVKDGFHYKSHSRAGTIYYIENRNVLEIDFELSGVSGYDILIFIDSVQSWSLPIKKELPYQEKMEIKQKLIDWLTAKKIRAEF